MRSEQPDVTIILGNSTVNCDVQVNGESALDVHRVDVGDWSSGDASDPIVLTDDDWREVQRLQQVGVPLEVHMYTDRVVDGDLESEIQTFDEWKVGRRDD